MLLVGEDGWQCQTEGLDHPDQHDYEGGVVARFDGSEEDGLGGCYQAVMGGNLTGGSVTWTGSGMFAAINREICVEVMEGTWCCRMKSGYSNSMETVQLEMCGQQA